MDDYTIIYEIIYSNKYDRNIIDIKFLHGDNVFFNFKPLYSIFYSIFVQNYNSDYYYCQLSQNCEFEIENINNYRVLNIILTNFADYESKQTFRTSFSVVINDVFHLFLEKLKSNHGKVIKNSKW